VEAGDDVIVREVDLSELRRRLRHRQGRHRTRRAMPIEECGEVDVDELVAVHREHVTAVGPRSGRVADPASAPEALGLARAGELDAEAREVALELLLLAAETADDDALDAGAP
jgi:hypothetical protein